MKETTSKYLVRGLATGLLLTGLGAGYTTTNVAADDVIPGQEQLAPVTQSQSFTVTFKNMYTSSLHFRDAISINVFPDTDGNYIATIPENFLQNRIATTNLPADVDQGAYSRINDHSVMLNVAHISSFGINDVTVPVYFAGDSSTSGTTNSVAPSETPDPVLPSYSDSTSALPSSVAPSETPDPVLPSYSDSTSALPSSVAPSETPDPVLPSYSSSISTLPSSAAPSQAPEPVMPHGSDLPSSVAPSESATPSESSESIAPSYSSSLSVVPSSITLPKSSDLPGSVAPSNSVPMPPVSSIDSSASSAPITSASSASQTSVAPSESAVSVAPRNVRQTPKPAIDLATVTAAPVITSVNATTQALAPKLVAGRTPQKSVAVAKQTTDTPATTDTVTTPNASQPTQTAVASVAHHATVAEAAQKNALPNIFKNNTTTHLDLTNNTPAYKPESTFNTGNVTSVASILVSAFSGFAYFLGGVPKGVTRFFDWMFNLFGK
ncbi:hypothetical protein [Weissella cibaria]|uniref:hypothetical protein n=1 Tax=Weissella cibaria TaxID=137591 RepID=UPI000D0B9332|nr:hypothetical protein [Weissella cibaria]AVO66661.1 hypothetical protein C6N67_06475 [Weissella cibaria]NKN29531.1 hypothetical protein [Weissella cibaria]NKN78429.1 hypothetical protein [Weissella cibaria]NKN96350.1 hypothetical protein [Weissella cibaria]NKN98706.1 hypothetical protein [Weissella cibaria]